jgi:hypothetical protein
VRVEISTQQGRIGIGKSNVQSSPRLLPEGGGGNSPG